MSDTAPRKRQRIDWEAVERDYRTGKFTLRELETKHGASYSEISRRSKREAWQKDLRDVINAATNAAVLREITTGAQTSATDVVLAAAEIGKQVILRHRGDLGSARDVALRMLGELDLTSTHADDLRATFEKIHEDTDPETLASAQQQFRDFMRLHSRVGSIHKLADAFTKLQAAERKAFNIEDGQGAGDDRRPTEFTIRLVKAEAGNG